MSCNVKWQIGRRIYIYINIHSCFSLYVKDTHMHSHSRHWLAHPLNNAWQYMCCIHREREREGGEWERWRGGRTRERERWPKLPEDVQNSVEISVSVRMLKFIDSTYVWQRLIPSQTLAIVQTVRCRSELHVCSSRNACIDTQEVSIVLVYWVSVYRHIWHRLVHIHMYRLMLSTTLEQFTKSFQ